MMKFEDYRLHLEFIMGEHRYRITDVGSRSACAIRVSDTTISTKTMGDSISSTHEAVEDRTVRLTKQEATRQGWFRGPPYAVAEMVIDEDDQMGSTRLVHFALGIDDE
jgi:hypothetical protein